MEVAQTPSCGACVRRAHQTGLPKRIQPSSQRPLPAPSSIGICGSA